MTADAIRPPPRRIRRPRIDAGYVRPLQRGAVLVALAIVAVASLAITPLATGPGLLLHAALTLASVVVCFMVFVLGRVAVDRERNPVIQALSSVFLSAGLLDFVHLLFFQARPSIVIASGPELGMAAFLSARLLVALGMVLIAVAVTVRRVPVVALWAAACLAVLLPASAWLMSLADAGSLIFAPGTGLTPLTRGIEHAAAAMSLAAAAALFGRLSRPQTYAAPELFTACCLMALSGYCFTLDISPPNAPFMIGHVLKLLAYALVCHAMFGEASRKPRHAAPNAALEDGVRMRTAQLEASNRELEAFSYSVAHDLRSPLGAIEGFGDALERKLDGRLSERERHYFSRIRAATHNMGDMIEALLELARLSRVAPDVEAVDLQAMALSVLDDLNAAEPGRDVAVGIQPGLQAYGDRRLLRLALANLLGNAWKFSAKQHQAVIEVGVTDTLRGRAFFVRDNGAGFDMEYVGRLFCPFQRLHSQTEFAGHGIGLAHVARIVALHGGRVWAESAPGCGATFFFTLEGSAAASQFA